MSTTLLIRHLCSDLSILEREDFLKHFGAQKVWFINPNSNTAFASFKSKSAAEEALLRLHQLELFGKRLSVEYAHNSSTSQCNGSLQKDCIQVKQFIDCLNGWNPSIGLLQPPPPCLNYKYPSATPQILFNIMFALQKHENLYVQTVHLMNKMGLDPPFNIINEEVKSYIKDCLQALDIMLPEIQTVVVNSTESKNISSEESEMSSNEEAPSFIDFQTQLPKKRKSNLKRINKKPKLLLQMPPLNPDKRKSAILDTKEVFDETPLQEVKKIEVKFKKTHLDERPAVNNTAEIIGTIGKINPVTSTIENTDACNNKQPNDSNKSVQECNVAITSKELLENKISLKDMKSLPIFKNYHPGTPSMRLYIKNLSKDVDASDIERIYKRYVADCDANELEMFSVRVMQEGRMKGQAFILLPSVVLSERALSETNGYILKNKPMVVQFARTAK